MTYSIEDFKTVIDKAIDYYSIHIETTSDGSLCDTLDKITAYYKTHGRLLIWDGESEETIYDSPYYNVLFRAWHDYHHIKAQLAFTGEGEKLVADKQKQDVHKLTGGNLAFASFCEIVLDAEIVAQVDYYNAYGAFVDNQRQFSLDYIANHVNIAA